MLPEEEVRSALMGWQAASAALETIHKEYPGSDLDDGHGRGLAAGYVGALEMVLRDR